MNARRIPTDSNLTRLPAGLPRPVDDGAARHLTGRRVPHVRLRSTSGDLMDIAEAAEQLAVFFCYPATLAPPAVIPGEWSEIPGARGCTIQNIGFRDSFGALAALGARVYGVSGQGQRNPDSGLREQCELRARLGLPFDLLNDSRFELATALSLPTFVAELKEPWVDFEGRRVRFALQGKRLYKRVTFVVRRGIIEKVFYPVFPPDRNAEEVLAYLASASPRTAP